MATFRSGAVRGIVAMGLVLSTAIAGAAAPVTQPAAPADLSERQRNLLLQLSNAEANIQAINKALRQTGYKVGLAYDQIQSGQKGNELMDRKGGGPVRWDDFYGRTARDFYAPQSWGTYHREGNGKTVDIQIAANYTQLKRPPQFDFIYRANAGQIARAGEQIAALQRDQAALLARRQFHESEQSRLWAVLSWERVKDQEIAFHPLYRLRLKPSGADAAVLRSVIRFIRVADASLQNALDSLNADQGASFLKVNQDVGNAYATLQRELADALYAADLKAEHRGRGDALKTLCKRLAEECEVIADNYKKAIDSDRAKEDTSKLQYRGELQSSLAYLAAAMSELDQQITATAEAWGVSGEAGVANGDEVKVGEAAPSGGGAIGPRGPLVAPAQPPVATPAPSVAAPSVAAPITPPQVVAAPSVAGRSAVTLIVVNDDDKRGVDVLVNGKDPGVQRQKFAHWGYAFQLDLGANDVLAFKTSDKETGALLYLLIDENGRLVDYSHPGSAIHGDDSGLEEFMSGRGGIPGTAVTVKKIEKVRQALTHPRAPRELPADLDAIWFTDVRRSPIYVRVQRVQTGTALAHDASAAPAASGSAPVSPIFSDAPPPPQAQHPSTGLPGVQGAGNGTGSVLQTMKAKCQDQKAGNRERETAVNFLIENGGNDAESIAILKAKCGQKWASNRERETAIGFLANKHGDDPEIAAIMNAIPADSWRSNRERKEATDYLKKKSSKK